MKGNFKYTLLSLFFMATSLSAQGYMDDYCWDDGYDWVDDCCWDWEDCAWDNYCDSPSRVYVGPVYYYRKSRFSGKDAGEPFLIGNLSDREMRGHMWGVNGGFEYKEPCCLYFRADFTWSEGNLKGCPRGDLQEWVLDGRLGYTWGECCPCGWSLTPYVGIGYVWDDRTILIPNSGSDPEPNGNLKLNAKYRAWFIPIGLYGEVEIMCDFTAGLDVAWRPMFDTRVKLDAHNNNGLDINRDVEVNDGSVGDRYSWKIEVPLRWMVCSDWGFEVSVVPFWEYYAFGEVNSQTVTTDNVTVTHLGVPRLTEDAWGAKFLIGFRF